MPEREHVDAPKARTEQRAIGGSPSEATEQFSGRDDFPAIRLLDGLGETLAENKRMMKA